MRLLLRLAERYAPKLDQFTFIDLGCGKGRAMLFASEFPFRDIIGIEFSPDLYAIAQQNIRRFRSASQKCIRIETILSDASSYNFPPAPTVLFMFNPFGAEVMARVVKNLQLSLENHPRPMLIIYYYPVQRVLIETLRNIRLIEQSDLSLFSYCLYAVGDTH